MADEIDLAHRDEQNQHNREDGDKRILSGMGAIVRMELALVGAQFLYAPPFLAKRDAQANTIRGHDKQLAQSLK